MTAQESADSPQVIHVPEKHRYEIHVDGKLAGTEQYTEESGRRVFVHTVVDDAFAGQGLAAILVAGALDAAVAEGVRVVPVCPYVIRYVQRHDTWNDHLDHEITPEVLAAIKDAGL